MSEELSNLLAIVITAIIVPIITTFGFYLVNLIRKKLNISEYNLVIDIIRRITEECLSQLNEEIKTAYLDDGKSLSLETVGLITEILEAIKKELTPGMEKAILIEYADIEEFLRKHIYEYINSILRK